MKNKVTYYFNLIKKMPIGAKAAIVYTFASILTKGFNIITIPVFTRIMSSSEIGIFYTFTSWYTLISIVVSLALTSGGINIALVEYKSKRDEYQSSILTLTSIAAFIFLIIFMLNPDYWSNMLNLDPILIFVMIAAFVLEPAKEIWLARQRYEYQYKNVFFFTIISTIFATLVSFVIVIMGNCNHINDLGILRVCSTYMAFFAFDIILFFQIIKKGKTFYNKTFWIFSLKLSLPLIIHGFSKSILDVSDRTMISKFCGNNATGVYSTLYNLSTLSLIIWNAINSSFIPYLFDKLKDTNSDIDKDISKTVNPLISIYGVACIGLTLISPEIINLLTTPEYYEAIAIMPPVAAGIFLTCLYNLFGDVLTYYKKTLFIMISTLTAAGTNIVLNYLCIPRFGYIAAAYTTLFSYIILVCMQCIFMMLVTKRKIYNMKFLCFMSCFIVFICIFCNVLYSFMFLRYVIIFAIVITIIKFRKNLILLIQTIRK